MGNIDRSVVFKALCLYQFEHNLPEWLKYAKIVRGRLDSRFGKFIEEGGNENQHLDGFLVLEDGDVLAKRLKEDKIVLDKVIPPMVEIYDEHDLLRYIGKSRNGDNNNGQAKKARESAYVFDGKNLKVTRIREFNPNIKSLEDISFSHYLPKGFLSTKKEIDPDDPDEGIGLKTRNAIRLAVGYSQAGYPVKSYQIKSTPYSNAGMGVIAEYGGDGLVRTVHVEYKPNENLPFIPLPPGKVYDKFRDTLVAFRRIYGRDTKNGENQLVSISEGPINVSEILPSTLEKTLMHA